MSTKTCFHEACSCPVDPDARFCSAACETAKSQTGSERVGCDCGHAGCLGDAGKRGERRLEEAHWVTVVRGADNVPGIGLVAIHDGVDPSDGADAAASTERERARTPEEVAADERLDDRRKIEILERWRDDQTQLAVAVDEGMPGAEPNLLARIHRCLLELGQGEED